MQSDSDYAPMIHPKDIFNMDGKVVAIMGGAGKMGQSFAEILSNAGASVWIIDLNETKTAAIANKISDRSEGKVTGITCDLSNQDNISESFQQILDHESKIDSLIYNVYSKPEGYYSPFESYDVTTWKKVMESNVTGAFMSCQEVVKIFTNLGIPGSIVLTLSTYGIVSPDLRIYEGLKSKTNIYGGEDALTTPMAYTVSKSGLHGMIKWLAGAYGKHGIRVNGLTPGGVYDGQEEIFYNNYIYRVPLGRMATWDDYNGAILFLTSEASRYMTGANLVVDGGWTAI